MATISSSQIYHPDWLGHAPHDQQTALIQLLEAAPRLRQEEAHRMLRATAPRAIDEADAMARISTVIRYLATEAKR